MDFILQNVFYNHRISHYETLCHVSGIWSYCGLHNTRPIVEEGYPMRLSVFGSLFATTPFPHCKLSLAVARSLAPCPIPYMSLLITFRCLLLDQIFEEITQSNQVLNCLWSSDYWTSKLMASGKSWQKILCELSTTCWTKIFSLDIVTIEVQFTLLFL